MRLFTLLSTRPANGTLPDGTPAPALPQNSAIPVSQIAAVTLVAQVSPQDASKVVAQAIIVQLAGGGGVPVFRNLAPGNPAQQAAILAAFDKLRTDLMDDALTDVTRTYEERP